MRATTRFRADAALLHRLYGRRRYALAPTVVDCLVMLRQLNEHLGGDRNTAETLCVPRQNVMAWMNEHRKDGMDWPTRRCIWLTWCLVFHPERCQTLLDLMTWGQVTTQPSGFPVEDWSI